MSAVTPRAVLARAALAATLASCATFRPMTASPGDLADYRAFRVAAYEGTRLARAERYLEVHPKGAFADEVRTAFDEEEPRWFQQAQLSREGARRYLADLPHGPHADAALALLTALEQDMKEAELRDIARRVHYDEAKLESAAQQRRAVGEAILGAVGVLVSDDVYGVRRTEAARELRVLMGGPAAPTWGSVPTYREDDHFFLLPTRPERESRLVTLEIRLEEQGGLVTAARLEGSDLFVRWAEADQIVKLDPAAQEDRQEAQIHAQTLLDGALERRFPAATCQDLRRDRELFHRACGGWEASVTVGARVGDKDSIAIRGPARKARE
jgi:hypothetical protein